MAAPGTPRPSDPACGTTDPIVREGAFHAWQYSWRVRLVEKAALEGLPSLQELVRDTGFAILAGPPATVSLAPKRGGPRRHRHQELIEVLKRELEARHGRVHEMYVLLRSNRAPKLPRVLYDSAGRWRVLWRRLAARMLDRRRGELAPAHL